MPSSSLSVPALAGVVVCALLVRLYWRASKLVSRPRSRLTPPGPRRLPVFGNLLRLPRGSSPWMGYKELCEEFGNLVHLEVMGHSMLIINDPEIAVDLLEKHSNVHSSRPVSKMISLSGWDWSWAFFPYGQWWRRHRRVFSPHFHPDAIPKYHSAMEEGSSQLISAIIEDPEQYNQHIRYALGKVMGKIAHGLRVSEHDDVFMHILERAIESVDVLVKGSTLLEYFPFLARIPTWFPGTTFLKRLKEDRKAALALWDYPWTRMKQDIKEGKALPSIGSSMLEDIAQLDPALRAEEEEIAKNATAMIYAAGLDTQWAAMQALFVAMSLYPRVQQKAQAELDAMVGPDRLPTFEDRPALPYLNAFLKELNRWHTSTPLGVAHHSTADDEYNGFFIPSGTTTLVNAWAILHDPRRYPDPDEFIPERFLGGDATNGGVIDPNNIVFGFGRRVCPGRYFAEDMLFLFVARVLHSLDVSPPVDHEGKPIRIELRRTAGLVSYFEDSRCSIRPRSVFIRTSVRQGGDDAPL